MNKALRHLEEVRSGFFQEKLFDVLVEVLDSTAHGVYT